jgi:peptidoglycan hydrolase CwlO-like protein
MNIESLQSDWAIWLALASLVIAIVLTIPILLKQTARSKLNKVLSDLNETQKELRKTARVSNKTEKKLQKMLTNIELVKPRELQEAKDSVDDSKALTKILSDKMMVAQNHVRRVIHDEFPPAKHDRMRAKYLPQDVKEDRPFQF